LRYGIDGNAIAGSEDQEPPQAEPVAGNLNLACGDVNRALVVVWVQRQDGAGRQHRLGVERRMGEDDGRGHAVGFPHDHAHGLAFARDGGKLVGPVVGECRGLLLMGLGQRRPGLDAEQPPLGAARRLAGCVRQALPAGNEVGRAGLALGMDNAAPGRHEVDLARADRGGGAEAVPVPHLALE
jgi:hypothetical protein